MGKFGIWFGGIFGSIGLLFAAIGLWFDAQSRDLMENGLRTAGTVVGFDRSTDSDGDTTFMPQVTFTDRNGQNHWFASSVGSNPAEFERGDEVEVIYDPAQPDRAIIDSFTQRSLLPMVFSGLGLVFAAIGFTMVGRSLWRRKVIARLRQNGLAIQAEFLEFYRDTTMQVNGRNPFRVTCQAKHPANGQMQVFKSEPLWDGLPLRLEGKKLRVLVDPQDARHHYVDLSEYLGGVG